MSEFYIGLMSGTSVDGIDAVIVDFSENQPRVIATYVEPFDASLRQQIIALTTPGYNEIDRLGRCDRIVGEHFANAVLSVLAKSTISKSAIRAIGSHGQTLRHQPSGAAPYTLQIGDPNTIAEMTGLTTVADFRRADMASGGQGAPLVPAFHQAIFSHPNETRIILNVGGIANLTLLNPEKETIGFDTGPGNRLLDDWVQQCLNKPYDDEGAFARSGIIDNTLLTCLLDEPYFNLPPPKSTGRELFNVSWLEKKLQQVTHPIPKENVQATLLELTAQTIASDIKKYAPDAASVSVCGGGVHNDFLMERLRYLLKIPVASSALLGIDPDFVEAIAFAWLAKQTLDKKPGNLPSVTGAKKAVILGGIWPCTN